jgi:hypothetical protein
VARAILGGDHVDGHALVTLLRQHRQRRVEDDFIAGLVPLTSGHTQMILANIDMLKYRYVEGHVER